MNKVIKINTYFHLGKPYFRLEYQLLLILNGRCLCALFDSSIYQLHSRGLWCIRCQPISLVQMEILLILGTLEDLYRWFGQQCFRQFLPKSQRNHFDHNRPIYTLHPGVYYKDQYYIDAWCTRSHYVDSYLWMNKLLKIRYRPITINCILQGSRGCWPCLSKQTVPLPMVEQHTLSSEQSLSLEHSKPLDFSDDPPIKVEHFGTCK